MQFRAAGPQLLANTRKLVLTHSQCMAHCPPCNPAVESCCAILESYYGPNSTLPSRNCFCVESYWAELQELSGETCTPSAVPTAVQLEWCCRGTAVSCSMCSLLVHASRIKWGVRGLQMDPLPLLLVASTVRRHF